MRAYPLTDPYFYSTQVMRREDGEGLANWNGYQGIYWYV
jgi:hypothetical protein